MQIHREMLSASIRMYLVELSGNLILLCYYREKAYCLLQMLAFPLESVLRIPFSLSDVIPNASFLSPKLFHLFRLYRSVGIWEKNNLSTEQVVDTFFETNRRHIFFVDTFILSQLTSK